MTEPEPFDLLAPLPLGITVLEASAGTGKTYTIAALATRFVAEGIGLEQMLLVTFTRMATGELRERVRERLGHSERLLSARLAGADASDMQLDAGIDALDDMLLSGDIAVVTARRDRLRRALSAFDAATIETTHSFCSEVLSELGTLGDLDADASLTEHVDDLLEQVVDDLYIRRFLNSREAPTMDRRQAGIIAAAAIANPDAIIYPLQEPEDRDAAMRWRLAASVRIELAQRKRALGLITYDDLLGRLQWTLSGPNGDAALAMLRRRYAVVLIDEFQDTDPVQWDIVSRAFGDGDRRLVLIADPKQAIYAFRGADVHAYLRAAATATETRTLATNYRSDGPLLAGFDALFGGVRLGHPEIAYRQVSPRPGHERSRLIGTPSPGALRVRVLDRQTIACTPGGFASAAGARDAVARDVAADIVALLNADARIEGPGSDLEGPEGARVCPGDIAVLVDKHRNAAAIQRELEAASVPAVIAGAGSVFSTAAAGHWLTLLEALERPAAQLRARTAALTPLLGWDAARLADAAPTEIEALHGQLYRWNRIFATAGVAAMTDAVMVDSSVAPRVLARSGGERAMTDLQHVGELLHRAALEEGFGISALTAWLRQRIDAVGSEGAHGDERTRRLDSDAAAVQVLTIHRSKGLEWPVVYCPFLWDTGRIPADRLPVFFHQDGQRGVDVSLHGPGYEAHRRRHVAEERGEDLRLAYVALTRARHRTVVHWAGTWDARNSPLGRLLFSRDQNGEVAVEGGAPPSDEDAMTTLHTVAARAADPQAVRVEWARMDGLAPAWSGATAAVGELGVARLSRPVDRRWRRTSYSALTAAAHDADVGSEPEGGLLEDEPVTEPGVGGGHHDPASREPATALPLSTMAFGPAVGTLIHHALDLSDFAADSLLAELALRLTEAAGPRGIGMLGAPVAQVARGLALALATPIPALGNRPLSGVRRADRLDELTFELPLGGGDRPYDDHAPSLADVAALLKAALLEDAALSGYATRLADPLLAGVLRGYLTGSIDLALRVSDPGDRPRYAVIDYKTNWLAPAGEPLSAQRYRPEALGREMQRTHYLLQGLLYSVALHRFLRWRLLDYDPDRDLAGIHYLFLRGMTGHGSTGVFSWQPPSGLIPALSDLLDRGVDR